jgi:DnaJ-class molecular chaperone
VTTTCVVCQYTFSDLANELNVQGICIECEREGWIEAPATPLRPACPWCAGTGKSSSTPDGQCPSCDGSGRRPRPVDYSDNYPPLGGEAA